MTETKPSKRHPMFDLLYVAALLLVLGIGMYLQMTPRVAVVNVQQVMQQSDIGKSIDSEMRSMAEAMRTELSAAGEDEAAAAEVRRKYAARREQLLTAARSAMRRATDEVSSGRRLHVVIDSTVGVIRADRRADITEAVIAAMQGLSLQEMLDAAAAP